MTPILIKIAISLEIFIAGFLSYYLLRSPKKTLSIKITSIFLSLIIGFAHLILVQGILLATAKALPIYTVSLLGIITAILIIAKLMLPKRIMTWDVPWNKKTLLIIILIIGSILLRLPFSQDILGDHEAGKQRALKTVLEQTHSIEYTSKEIAHAYRENTPLTKNYEQQLTPGFVITNPSEGKITPNFSGILASLLTIDSQALLIFTGLLFIAAFFLFLSQVIKPEPALLLTGAMALFTPFIWMHRTPTHHTLIGIYFFLGLYFFTQAIKQSSSKYYVLTALSFFILTIASGNVLFGMLSIILITLDTNKQRVNTLHNPLALLTFIYLIILSYIHPALLTEITFSLTPLPLEMIIVSAVALVLANILRFVLVPCHNYCTHTMWHNNKKLAKSLILIGSLIAIYLFLSFKTGYPPILNLFTLLSIIPIIGVTGIGIFTKKETKYISMNIFLIAALLIPIIFHWQQPKNFEGLLPILSMSLPLVFVGVGLFHHYLQDHPRPFWKITAQLSILFVAALSVYSVINWDSINNQEYPNIQENIAQLADRLKEEDTIFIQDESHHFTLPLMFTYGIPLVPFNLDNMDASITYLEEKNRKIHILAIGTPESVALSLQDKAHRSDLNQSLQTTHTESTKELPLNRGGETYDIILFRVASNLDNLLKE